MCEKHSRKNISTLGLAEFFRHTIQFFSTKNSFFSKREAGARPPEYAPVHITKK